MLLITGCNTNNHAELELTDSNGKAVDYLYLNCKNELHINRDVRKTKFEVLEGEVYSEVDVDYDLNRLTIIPLSQSLTLSVTNNGKNQEFKYTVRRTPKPNWTFHLNSSDTLDLFNPNYIDRNDSIYFSLNIDAWFKSLAPSNSIYTPNTMVWIFGDYRDTVEVNRIKESDFYIPVSKSLDSDSVSGNLIFRGLFHGEDQNVIGEYENYDIIITN